LLASSRRTGILAPAFAGLPLRFALAFEETADALERLAVVIAIGRDGRFIAFTPIALCVVGSRFSRCVFTSSIPAGRLRSGAAGVVLLPVRGPIRRLRLGVAGLFTALVA
jgi:hypothetical protein